MTDAELDTMLYKILELSVKKDWEKAIKLTKIYLIYRDTDNMRASLQGMRIIVRNKRFWETTVKMLCLAKWGIG